MTCISQIENPLLHRNRPSFLCLPLSISLFPPVISLISFPVPLSSVFLPPIYLFLSLSICILFFRLTDQSGSPPSFSLSDHIFEQVVINDIQRLINYSPKRDRKYRERKKENRKREDERGGRRGVRWGGGGTGEANETNDEGGVRWGWRAWCLSCNVSEEIVCVCSHAKVSQWNQNVIIVCS